MKILIFGLNYAPELIGTGKYSGELGTWLSEHEHDVRVISAPPYYPEWKVNKGYHTWAYRVEIIDGVKVFRVPLYVPKKPNVFSRLLHLFSFAISSIPLLVLNLFWKPDLVITVVPTLFTTPGALLFSKFSGAKSLLHIQDFELDAMQVLGMGKNGVFSIFGFKIESWIIRHFDAVSTISHSMVKTAEQKLNSHARVFYFPNWVDVDFVTPDADDKIFREKWGISRNTKVIIYSGNLGVKQGLELVLAAAERMTGQRDVLFLIIGSGAAKERLVSQVRQLKLKNISFYPVQPYLLLPALMALGDIFLVVQKKGVADAVLPSKVTTILSAGKNALITAEKNSELGVLCTEYPGIAHRVPPENLDSFVETLNAMLGEIDVKNRKKNTIARKYAENFLDKQNILERFAGYLDSVIEKS
jgi:colanic acid biosynthesis glycosyl transferase WcaI